jgi:outer membrane autotransporter protein
MKNAFASHRTTPLSSWTVAPEDSRGRAKAGGWFAAGAVLGAVALMASTPAAADCVGGLSITCSSVGGTQGVTVGAGGLTPSGTTVEVQSGALVSTGNTSGISLGDNGLVTVRSGATVQNSASPGADSPYHGGIGANTIELNNNGMLIIEQGAAVHADGSATDSEAVNTIGSNNTILNRGSIRSTNAAIFSQAALGQNFILNDGTIEAGYVAGNQNAGLASVLGQNGVTAVDFTNRGAVIGSLNFGNLDDALRVYTGSSVTGHIDGGAGANLLTLNSDNSAADTFAPLSLGNFQTLINNSGTWTFNVPLASSGITSTTVHGGTLILGADASSYTGSIAVEAAGTLQSSAQFAPQSIANAGRVRFAQPTDASYAGSVFGTGGIEKTDGGTLTLTRDQSFTGGTTISAGTLQLGDGGTTGSVLGNILNNGTLAVDHSNTVLLTGSISGTGQVQQMGSGTTVLSGSNDYSGATTVSAGILRAGAAGAFSAGSTHTVAAGATLDLAGFSQSIAGLSNAGVVSLVGTAPGTTLTVTGPYIGSNGLLRLGTFLGGSGSATDRLVLSGSGAVASGNTQIAITQLGGLGALTTGNGIEVVSAVNGASTSANAFTLAGGHVDAGAYEYRLYDADANGAGENWYLRSSGPAAPAVPTYRAEVPLFAALPSQLRQMDLAMLGNLHQRIGDDDASASAAGANPDRRAWGRVITQGIDIRQRGTVSPTSDGRVSGFQAGTDLLATPNWRAGVYVGQLDGNVDVSGFAGGIAGLPVGRNDLRSEYLGIYGTYTSGTGLYADAVLQGARHRYDIESSVSPRIPGKGSSLLASIEAGQSFRVGNTWTVEPQVQLVHQQMDLDDANIIGAFVRQDPASSWLGRVGVRVKADMATAAGRFQPYGRVNLYRTANRTDMTRFVGPAGSTDIATQIGGTSAELAAGGTLTLSQVTTLYGELGKLWAVGGDARVRSSLQASLGVRVRW